MIDLEPGSRIIAESISKQFKNSKREAIDVRAADFDGVEHYVRVDPDAKNIMMVSINLPCLEEIVQQCGQQYLTNLYGAMIMSTPLQGYTLTLKLDLDTLPDSDAEKDALCEKLSCMQRDITGAPLWISLQCLKDGTAPPKPHYSVHYRPSEAMYVANSRDRVTVVFSIEFSDASEAAIVKVFLQEFEVTRRNTRDLSTAPVVAFSNEPPLELKGVSVPEAKSCIGFISLGLSKSNVDGKIPMDRVVGLVAGYRSFLLYHIKCSKTHMHSRMRSRVNGWMQVLNRAVPEKTDKAKRTATGRTFTRQGSSRQ